RYIDIFIEGGYYMGIVKLNSFYRHCAICGLCSVFFYV
ncbi:MAG: hypothetical protein Q617_SPSC00367G0001, partial [Streptococcus sp. DORA_10]